MDKVVTAALHQQIFAVCIGVVRDSMPPQRPDLYLLSGTEFHSGLRFQAMNLDLTGKAEYMLDDLAVKMPWRLLTACKRDLRHPHGVGEHQIFPAGHAV